MRTTHTPGCDGVETPTFRTPDRNRRTAAADFVYVGCQKCGLIRLETIPPDLGAYYPSTYHELPTRKRLERLSVSDLTKIAIVRRFVRSGRLLEIGPAHGTFALQASRAGFIVDTIEMEERCCAYLRDVVGVHAICSDSPETAMRSLGNYNVIALWHVIEHLRDPWAVMRVAAQRCERGGVLVIATPNPEAWQFSIMRSYWPHIDAPRHLYLLPRAVLKAYLSALGFRVVLDTTSDRDARRWNRFGWQRLLMNQVRGAHLQRLGFLIGYACSWVVAPVERCEPRGSAYTLVFEKT